MPLSLRLSSRAEADLDGIAVWVAEQADSQTAIAYVKRVRRACDKIVVSPRGGTRRDSLGRGYRSVSFERRLRIFYRVEQDEVVIKRIVHGSRDAKRALRHKRPQ